MDVGVKSTAFTFGTVLCIFLLGLGAGSLAGGRRAEGLARPLEAFLDYQLLLLAVAAAAVVLLARLPPGTPVYSWFFDYWRQDPFFQLGADWDAGALARLYGLLPLALFGVPTVLMGLSFGALQRAVQGDPAASGRKVGLLQAANIAGCTAGSLLTGLLLLERFGTAGTLRLLVAAGGLAFLLVRARAAGLSRGLVARAGAILLLLAALPSNDALWKRLHGVTADAPPSFIGEDASAVSVVVPGEGHRWRVTVNGLPHSWLPYEGIHTLLGAVPAVIHPSPRDVVVVGLGSGETAWAVGCRGETRSLRVYEIAAAQPRLLRAVSTVAPFAGLVELLSDPRLTRGGGGRAPGPRPGGEAVRRRAGRRDVPHERGQRQPLLARVLPALREPTQAGRDRVHAEAEPPRGPHLRRGAAPRPRPRQHRGGEQRAAADRPPGLGGATAAAGGGGPLRPGDAPGDQGPAPRGGPRPPQPRGPRGPQPRPVSARRVRDAGGLVRGDGGGTPS